MTVNFCIEWLKSFKYLDEVKEYNIDFKNKEVQLLKFLDTYGTIGTVEGKRVNICLSKEVTKDDIELLIDIYKLDKYNIAVRFEQYDAFFVDMLKENFVPFYFLTPAFDWDTFEYFYRIGASDIYISGELGFDIQRVHKIAKDVFMQVRCYVNICQASHKYGTGLKDFYIRPEDLDFYSDFVDVFEFYNSKDRQNTLYEIYTKDKEWNGKLRELIKGMTSDVNNYYILGTEFANRRSQCQKKCLKGEKCRLCDRLEELVDSLEKSKTYEVFKRREN